MISSDKAVRPTSVMGATKRIAEMLVSDAANRSGRAFSVVRFGNVLGSRGSIVPIFQKQIAKGGPVTVTHPEMRRFFMTIPEAVHLVLQAAAMGSGGEVFVLNMGEQIRILDLAEDLIRLSGLEPGRDVDIVFTGIRPGEKLIEELWDARSDIRTTTHPEILRMSRDEPINDLNLMQAVGELHYLANDGDTAAILHLLDQIIPGASVSSTPPPDLISIV
jgi:FlaA1/EpsC-like NDP-sugar epimerase